MAESAILSVARQVGSLLVEEAKFLYGVESKVEELQQELVWMQCFIKDVSMKQEQDELVKLWASQVKDLAYRSEDVVEKFIYHVSPTDSGGNRYWQLVKGLSRRYLVKARRVHEVGSEIETLTNKILKLNTRLMTYGVKIKRVQDPIYNTVTRDLRRRSSNERVIMQMERSIHQVVYLLSNPEGPVVVGVVGMGGLGKSTLSEAVYNDEDVQTYFESRLWIGISNKPEGSILREMYAALFSHQMEDGDDEKLLDQHFVRTTIKDELTQRRCLVVLQNVVSMEAWDLLKNIFPLERGESASRILLTTRVPNIVSYVSPDAYCFQLSTLDDETCWKLLLNKVFGGWGDEEENETDSEMVELGKRMCRYTRGIPACVALLGDVLATKATVAEWEAVYKYLDSESKRINSYEDPGVWMGKLFELSYKYLPFDLELCFLCFGYFPQDYDIETETLYQLWMAEGLIRGPEENVLRAEGVCMYDIADKYLQEFITRGMVQVEDVYANGRVKSCRLISYMGEFCLIKCKEKFLELVTKDDLRRLVAPNMSLVSSGQVWKTQRVIIPLSNEDNHALSSNFPFSTILERAASQLRSFVMYFPPGGVSDEVKSWVVNLIKAAKLLRILHLNDVLIDNLPDDLASCIHARYLKLGLSTSNRLSFACKLCYLQTLDLRSSRPGLLIPNKLWKLKRLIHLYLPPTYKVKGKLRLSQSWQMETLVNFDPRHLYTDDLMNLVNLRKVSFTSGIKTMDSECLKLVLESPILTPRLFDSPISTLKVEAEAINQDPRILYSNPDASIQKLSIEGKINRSVQEILFPDSITSLSLCRSELQGNHICDLKLPMLRSLFLRENAILGEEIVFSAQSCPELGWLSLNWPENEGTVHVKGSLPDSCKLSIKCGANLVGEIPNALQGLLHKGGLQVIPSSSAR